MGGIYLENISMSFAVPFSGIVSIKELPSFQSTTSPDRQTWELASRMFENDVDIHVGSPSVHDFNTDVNLALDRTLGLITSAVCVGFHGCEVAIKRAMAKPIKKQIV